MSIRMFLVASLSCLAACEPAPPDLKTACETYLASYNSCLDEFGDETTELPSETCGFLALIVGDEADALRDDYVCANDVLINGDCSTPEAGSETLAASGVCLAEEEPAE